MVDAWALRLAALTVTVLGFIWLAMAMEPHWKQIHGATLPAARVRIALRTLGGICLCGALLLCLRADHASMAVLVWTMLLAASAAIVAMTLSWRPHWLRAAWPVRRGKMADSEGAPPLNQEPGGLLLPVTAVTLTHIALLGWVSATLIQEPVLAMPTVIGQLVSQAPEEPVKADPPKPKVERPPEPVPPPPEAPPSEKAVTVPPEPPPPESTEASEVEDEVAPVIPPRSDASFLNNPAPLYPRLSRQLGEQGRVLFDVYILPDGSVGEIRLKQSSGYQRLDDSALEAVRRWRYVPASRGGVPIPFWYVQPVEFTLN